MPRITSEQQFIRYQQLTETYRLWPSLFSRLSWHVQVELEQFYQPHKVHTVESLAAYQAELRKKDPSLGNRAGKHYQWFVGLVMDILELLDHADSIQLAPPKKRAKGERRPIRVRGVARQEIAVDKVARVLLEIAKQMARDEEAKTAEEREENGTPPRAA